MARANDNSTDHYLSAGKIRELVLRLAASHELGPQHNGAQQHKAICRRAVALVAKHFALPVSEIRGKSRRQAVADARGVVMYFIRRLTVTSYAEIGRIFGAAITRPCCTPAEKSRQK